MVGNELFLSLHRILLVSLLSTRDPPTLLEVARLLHVAISNKDLKALWLKTIEESSALYENLTFILKNSTNCKLKYFMMKFVIIVYLRWVVGVLIGGCGYMHCRFRDIVKTLYCSRVYR